MSADHPLIGLDVRVGPGNDGDDTPYEFVGILAGDVSSWATTVLRSDGKLCAVANDRVTFRDPCHAARMLRAHAADSEARSRGLTVAPEYTPPRWVPANDVEDGWPFLAAVDPDGEYIALEPSGKRLLPGDTAVFRSRNALVLIGEWPPLPKGKS